MGNRVAFWLTVVAFAVSACLTDGNAEPRLQLDESAHANLFCIDCHFYASAKEGGPNNEPLPTTPEYICKRCHSDKYSPFAEKLHFMAGDEHVLNLPTCIDCHGHHDAGFTAEARRALVSNCGTCHEDIFNMYKDSVHCTALLADGNLDVPACLDCHSAHAVGAEKLQNGPLKPEAICKNCHADKKLMDNYRLSTAVLTTYIDEFHGYVAEGMESDGSGPMLAGCTNCHGNHNISATGDTKQIKDRLITVCAGCHEGEAVIIPDSWLSHYIPSIIKRPLIFIATVAVKGMFLLLTIGFFLQLFIHAWRYLVGR